MERLLVGFPGIFSLTKFRLFVIFQINSLHPPQDSCGIGLDVLHPIQPEAMDIFELKTTFGADLTFQGGVFTQEILPPWFAGGGAGSRAADVGWDGRGRGNYPGAGDYASGGRAFGEWEGADRMCGGG